MFIVRLSWKWFGLLIENSHKHWTQKFSMYAVAFSLFFFEKQTITAAITVLLQKSFSVYVWFVFYFFVVFSLIHTTISFVLRDCCYVPTLCFNNFLSGMFFPVPLLVHHFSNLFNKAFNFNEMERSLLYNGLDSVRNCVWIYDFPVYLQSNQTLRCKSPVWCSLMFTYGLNKHFSFATIWKINSRTD